MEKVFVGCWCVCEQKEQQQDNSIEIRAAIYSSVERQLEKTCFLAPIFFLLSSTRAFAEFEARQKNRKKENEKGENIQFEKYHHVVKTKTVLAY